MYVVMPAAGSATRFGSQTPKQFLPLANRTVIEHSLAPFLEHPDIKKIIVVLTLPSIHWDLLPVSKHAKIDVVEGGAERSESVLNGMIYLDEIAQDDDWVMVHDAARPLLTSAMLDQLIAQVRDHPVGGLLALPVRDTLKKQVENGVKTIDRSTMYQAQTPQMFRYQKLLTALARHLDVTDEAQALELMGEQIKIVEGELRNFKITHPSDLALAEKIIGGKS